MGLAWVAWSPEKRAFEVETGSNRFYELYLSTRPELFRPEQTNVRSRDNFYSSRIAEGRLLPSADGRALFPLPSDFAQRFPNGNIYFVVKTFADEAGRSPALSPVFGGNPAQVVLTDVDPAGGTAMGTSVTDFEALAARLVPQASVRANGGPTGRARAAGTTERAARPRARRRREGTAVAQVLALTFENVRDACGADPRVPGKPSRASVVEAMSAALALVPTPGTDPTRGPSLAATLNGHITGSQPHGSGRELARHVLRARTRSTAQEAVRSREQFIQAIAAIAPMLLQALPTILPMIMPLLQNLLGGLAKGKSLGAEAAAPAAPGGIGALLQKMLAAAAKGAAAPPPGTPAAQQPTPAAQPVPPQLPVAPQAPAGQPAPVPPPADVAAAPAQPPAVPAPGADGAAAAMPAVTPEQAAALLGSLQGFSGSGGSVMEAITGHSASPGTDMLKSVVERLPIDKMFDPHTWMPTSAKYDEWRSTLPWEMVLSLSDPTAGFGALFVPGRRELKPLEGVKVEIVNRTLTRLDGAGESWAFLSDRPARIQVEVVAGAQGLTRPFVDVRVSRDGTAAGGIWRAVFRLESLGANERQVATIEVPPEVLAQAATDGRETCMSVRVIQQTGDEHFATEVRACFHVVNPQTLVVEPNAILQEAGELDAVPGLERQVPRTALATDVRSVEWRVGVGTRAAVSGLARYLPLSQRVADGEAALDGGVVFSPLGLVDLAKRSADNQLGAEELAALADAIDGDAPLRQRLSLHLREAVESQLVARAEQGIGIRAELGWLPAYLVSFTGAGADGNPARRAVLKIRVPVPRGVSLRAL